VETTTVIAVTAIIAELARIVLNKGCALLKLMETNITLSDIGESVWDF